MITQPLWLNGHNGHIPGLSGPLPESAPAGPMAPLSTSCVTTADSAPQFTETADGTIWHRQTARSLQNHLIANFIARITNRSIFYRLDGTATSKFGITLTGETTAKVMVSERALLDGSWVKTLSYPFTVATEVPKAAL